MVMLFIGERIVVWLGALHALMYHKPSRMSDRHATFVERQDSFASLRVLDHGPCSSPLIALRGPALGRW